MKKWMPILLLLLAACQREMPVQKQSVLPPARTWEAPLPLVNYYQGTHAAEAVQLVRAKVGEPFRVLNIRIDDDSVGVQVRDPKKRENVDEYRVDHGRVKDPVPVRLFGDTDQATLDANVFDPATVDLTKVADLIRQGNEKVQLEGREMTGISIERNMFEDSRPVMIDVNYHGTRKSGYLRTDRKGGHAEASVF